MITKLDKSGRKIEQIGADEVFSWAVELNEIEHHRIALRAKLLKVLKAHKACIPYTNNIGFEFSTIRSRLSKAGGRYAYEMSSANLIEGAKFIAVQCGAKNCQANPFTDNESK